jgi:hypothetical protein
MFRIFPGWRRKSPQVNLATSSFHNQYIYSYMIVSHTVTGKGKKNQALAMKSNFQANS